jgi:ACT domain-containing protein
LSVENRQSEIGNVTMAHEDLIYRITRAVYDRLGTTAEEQTVEQLVTDIYRQVEPFIQTNGTPYSTTPSLPTSSSVSSTPREGSSDRLIISVFGVDHPGIVAGVAQILAEAECSIVDINQTVVQGKFAMVIIGDASRARENTTELKERLRTAGEKLGVRIYAQREDLFNAMHRV